MGLFHEVIAASRRHDLDVLHAVEHGKRAKGRTVAPQLVGVDDGWDVMLTQEPEEESLRRLCVPAPLKEHIQHNAMFVDRPPQPMSDAPDLHTHFVEMPPGTPAGFPVAQVLGERVTEFDTPAADGLTGDANPSFQQQFFDVSVAQREAVVKPDGVADDGQGKPVAGELLTAQHRITLRHQLATTLALRWEQWSQLAPLLVRQFIASYHTSFLPVDDTLRTEPSRCLYSCQADESRIYAGVFVELICLRKFKILDVVSMEEAMEDQTLASDFTFSLTSFIDSAKTDGGTPENVVLSRPVGSVTYQCSRCCTPVSYTHLTLPTSDLV